MCVEFLFFVIVIRLDTGEKDGFLSALELKKMSEIEDSLPEHARNLTLPRAEALLKKVSV